MALDLSNLNIKANYTSLLPSSSRNAVSGDLITQWSMLRVNSKAYKAALEAEARGYLRKGDAPVELSISDKVRPAADHSTTIKDILEQLGIKSAAATETKTATDTKTSGDAAADKTDAAGTAKETAKEDKTDSAAEAADEAGKSDESDSDKSVDVYA